MKKKVKNFDEYLVDENGNVFGTRVFKVKPQNHKCGYLMCNLYKDKKRKAVFVHRLIAEAFIPNPDNKPQVNHKNGDKTDNRVENLEWTTAAENMSHAYKELKRNTGKPRRKVINSNGEIFESMREAGRKCNVAQAAIWAAIHGHKGTKTAAGLTWSYYNENL